jgi:hypothetical protein
MANALLLWLGYEWLSVAESTRLRLVVSALEALAFLALACWLHGAAFVYFRGESKLNDSFRVCLRHLALLTAAAIFVIVIYGLITWAAAAAAQPAFQLASWLTLHLRKPVKPAAIARIVQALFWIVRWVLLPVAFVPALSAIAARGWSIRRGTYSWKYWLAAPLLLLAGLQLPLVLLRWIPPFDAFAMQFASFSVRGAVAYLLFVGAALGLAFVTARESR